MARIEGERVVMQREREWAEIEVEKERERDGSEWKVIGRPADR